MVYFPQSAIRNPQSLVKSPLKTFFDYGIVIIMLCCCLNTAKSQTALYYECSSGDEPYFEGEPEATLCQQYGNFVCDVQIGASTLITKSSQIPAGILSGNVCIIGDFEINSFFIFQNATVKITPGVKITLKSGPNPFTSAAALHIDNSRLFACTGLWQGIQMGLGSTIETRNNTRIEDAEKAIFANVSCGLSIESTTFNRNRTGIELVATVTKPSSSAPTIWNFQQNFFLCTAPLNGTLNQITQFGVKLKNVGLAAAPTGINLFRDITYGIYAEGTNSFISGQGLNMQNIKKDGIYMEFGYLNLTNSIFRDFEKGINIGTAVSVFLDNEVEFKLNPWVAENPEHRTGIYIPKFAINAVVKLTRIHFDADMNAAVTRLVRGVHLKGGDVGPGTKIFIGVESDFFLRAKSSQGIFLDGEFPRSCNITINNCHFRVSSVSEDTGGAPPQGINASGGDKHNLSITANTFTGYANQAINGNFATCVFLQDSNGDLNEVSGNNYSDEINYCAFWNRVDNFRKTKFCSNYFYALGGVAFQFNRTCSGTVLRTNEIHGTSIGVNITASGVMSTQLHRGNQWFNVFWTAGPLSWEYESLFHARSLSSDPLMSIVTVHTQRSTCSIDPQCWNPFHPKVIDPPGIGDFFDIQEGTPASGCPTGAIEFTIDDSDIRIAEGLYIPPANAPTVGWSTKRYLYDKLMKNPGLVGTHTSLSPFLSAHTNTSVGKFYAVDEAIAQAWDAASPIGSASQQAMYDLEDLFENLGVLQNQMSQYVTPPANLQQDFINFLAQINDKQNILDSFNTVYRSQRVLNLSTAYTLNESITTSHAYEANEKLFNQIRLLALIQQNGQLTANQVSTLQAIAEQDPDQGGSAVGYAWSFLPECARPEQALYTETVDRSILGPFSGKKMLVSQTGLSIAPNPASSHIIIQNPKANTGTIFVLDMMGKVVQQQNLFAITEQVILDQTQPKGMYIVRIICNDGSLFSSKLIFQGN